MAIDVTIITQPEERAIYGVWGKSSDKTVSKDIPALSKEYYGIVGKEPGLVLPFFVLSKDYAKDTGRFDLLIGAPCIAFCFCFASHRLGTRPLTLTKAVEISKQSRRDQSEHFEI